MCVPITLKDQFGRAVFATLIVPRATITGSKTNCFGDKVRGYTQVFGSPADDPNYQF